LISEKPEVVTRFLRATLKGWQDAVGNSEEAVAMTLKYAEVSVHELQERMMEAQMPLVHTGEGKIGWMKPERWNEMYQILLDQKSLAGPFDVTRAYTLEFLKAV
jgi:NitT/TauT family transport system substrate-binding protein